MDGTALVLKNNILSEARKFPLSFPDDKHHVILDSVTPSKFLNITSYLNLPVNRSYPDLQEIQLHLSRKHWRKRKTSRKWQSGRNLASVATIFTSNE